MDERAWAGLMERYGQQVTLYRAAGEARVRAFFQPVREKGDGEVPSPVGRYPAGKYLYLGPAGENLEDVERLEWNGRKFRFIRVRDVPVGTGTAYRWAMAEELDRGSEA